MCFARIRLYQLRGWILYHDCVSVIVSRFTFLIEDFAIYCYQVTKLFCSMYCDTIAFPARGPCNLGSLAYFPILVFREVSKDTVRPQIPLLQDVANLNQGKCLRVCPLMPTLLRLQDCLRSPPTTLANLATGFPVPVGCPYCCFFCGFCRISHLVS